MFSKENERSGRTAQVIARAAARCPGGQWEHELCFQPWLLHQARPEGASNIPFHHGQSLIQATLLEEITKWICDLILGVKTVLAVIPGWERCHCLLFLYGSALLAGSPAQGLKCYIPPRDQYVRRENVHRRGWGGGESWQYLAKK